jgi:hypothetical protein
MNIFCSKLIRRTILIKIPERNFRINNRIDYNSVLETPGERPRKKGNLYCPKQNLVFDDGKLKLINTNNSNIIRDINNQYYFFAATGLALALSSGGLIYSGYFITSIFSTLTSIFFMKSTRNHYRNLDHVVKEFNLLENGKEVEIITLKRKFDVNIKFLSKPNKIELQTLTFFNPNISDLLRPIVVDKGLNKGFYYIAADASFENKEELISAIMNNSYIDVFNKVTSRKLMSNNE